MDHSLRVDQPVGSRLNRTAYGSQKHWSPNGKPEQNDSHCDCVWFGNRLSVPSTTVTQSPRGALKAPTKTTATTAITTTIAITNTRITITAVFERLEGAVGGVAYAAGVAGGGTGWATGPTGVPQFVQNRLAGSSVALHSCSTPRLSSGARHVQRPR